MSQIDGLRVSLKLDRPDFSLSVDLQLPQKGVTVLFGPSGSGKTTLLRCVAGLEKAQGQVIVKGDVWQDSDQSVFKPVWQRDIGYVFQEASLFAHLNVQENLNYGVTRVDKPGLNDALHQVVALLGIGHLLKRDVHGLSGGERQRVAIARALSTLPKSLLLDEPLAALDVSRRQEILPWLEGLHRELAIPVIYVTHAMQELTRLADHVVLLESGKAVLQGSVMDVLSDAVFSRSVAGEAGSVLKGRVQAHDERFHLTDISVGNEHLWVRQVELPIGTEVRLHVHANDVSLVLSEPIGSSIQNRLRGLVDAVSDDLHPAHALVRVNCGGLMIVARVTKRALADLKLQTGCPVWCQIKSVALAGS